MFSNNTINAKPVPKLNNVTIQTGTKSLREMIQSISHSILLKGVLGGHSGNILNGDFSMGFNPGLHIKNGEILGWVKNGMVSGNVYDLLQNVVVVENILHPSMRIRCITQHFWSIQSKSHYKVKMEIGFQRCNIILNAAPLTLRPLMVNYSSLQLVIPVITVLALALTVSIFF